MKKTKILTCLLAMTLVAGLMTGCGKKADTTAETAESTEAVVETETEETEPVITSVSLADAGTGITVEGMTDASDVKVADVDADTDASIKDLAAADLSTDVTAVVSYDMSMVNADGDTVQPEGDITVTIPITDELKNADGNAYAVYYFNPDDNTVQNMDCSVSEDNVTFQTTHFSVYTVVKFTDPAMEPEPIAETEEAEPTQTKDNKTEAGTDNTSVESKTQEAAPAAVNTNLPGENRNGRYADIPESVMPAGGEEWYFYDSPVMTYTWSDGVVADVYADYNRTQVIASFSSQSHDATGMNLIAEQYNTGIGIVIYNGQYAIVYYDALSRSISEE